MRKLDHRVKLAKVVLMHVWSYNGCILIRYGADYALETSHTVRLDHESHPNPANLASPAFARYPRSSDEMRTLLKRLWFEGKIAGWSSGMLHVCKWFEVHTFFLDNHIISCYAYSTIKCPFCAMVDSGISNRREMALLMLGVSLALYIRARSATTIRRKKIIS